MLKSQVRNNIDILHCSSKRQDMYKYIDGVYKTKIYYALIDTNKFYKIEINTLAINYNSVEIDDSIKDLIIKYHTESNKITLEEILKEDKLINTSLFKEKATPHVRNQKINIINGN